MVSDRTTAARIAALTQLVAALRSFRLRYGDRDVESARAGVADHIEHSIVPRLRDPNGPLVVAVVGQSGSGKSTLINSLAHRSIAAAGPLRPMTRTAVAWVGERSPEPLDRLMERIPVEVRGEGRPPTDGLVFVDTPEPGIAVGGVSIAHSVLDVADVCLLVASADRYADAAGWELIEMAARMRTPTVFVLNRLVGDPHTQQTLVDDFAGRLVARGLLMRPGAESIIGIAEGPTSRATDGLPHDWITGLRKEVEAFAEPSMRELLVASRMQRSIDSIHEPLRLIREALVDESAARSRLLDPIRSELDVARAHLGVELSDGSFSDLGHGTAHLAADLAAVAARRSSAISRRIVEHWERDQLGPDPSANRPDLWSHGEGFVERARSAIVSWSTDLPVLIAQATGRRRPKRRITELARVVERLVVDPAFQPAKRPQRRLAASPGVVDAARRLLAEALGDEFAVDAARFEAIVGGELPDGLLQRLRWDEP